MSITAGSDIVASDFVSTSSGASDSGKVAKLDAHGKIPGGFIQGAFGGNGSDGALSISSGTTTIDLAGAAVVVKNYTTIAITGTGQLAFTNPATTGTVVFLLSMGAVTITSSATPAIDMRGIGAAGGASTTGSGSGSSADADGHAGSDGPFYSTFMSDVGHGPEGSSSVIATPGALPTLTYRTSFLSGLPNSLLLRYRDLLWIAAGGGSGNISHLSSAWSATSGKGGRGAGTLVIECAGAWNFTATINLNGQNGDNGVVSGASVAAGGGGAGAGGLLLALYNYLTASSGTVSTNGGTGGNVASLNSRTGVGGNGAASGVSAGTGRTSSSVDGTKTGGDGAPGASYIGQNRSFV